jgi:hypothetical protein
MDADVVAISGNFEIVINIIRPMRGLEMASEASRPFIREAVPVLSYQFKENLGVAFYLVWPCNNLSAYDDSFCRQKPYMLEYRKVRKD